MTVIKSFDAVKSRLTANLPLLIAFLFGTMLLWTPLNDPDFWWHLRLGQTMLLSHAIPRTDFLSWTMYGKPFVDFYWLSEIILAALFNVLHPLLLTIAFAVLTVFVLWLRLRHNFTWRSTFVVLLLAIAIQPTAGVRPLVFSWLFFVVLLEIIERADRLSFLKTGMISLVLFVFWFNMHYGFVLPLLYLGLLLFLDCVFLVFAWLEQDWAPKPFLTKKQFLAFCIIATMAFIGSFLTPYGTNYIRTILQEAVSVQSKADIAEWQAITIKFQLGFCYFLISLTTFAAAAYKKLWRAHDWIIFTLFFIIGASGMVHAPFFLLLIAPTFVKAISLFKIPKSIAFYSKLYLGILTTIGVLVIFGLQVKAALGTPFLAGSAYPTKAIAFIRQRQPSGKLFNEYNWGGYLTYFLPTTPVFINGSMTSWKNGKAYIMDDYTSIDSLSPSFLTTLTKYQPDWFFVDSNTPIAQWLKTQADYKVLYTDDIATIAVRNQSE